MLVYCGITHFQFIWPKTSSIKNEMRLFILHEGQTSPSCLSGRLTAGVSHEVNETLPIVKHLALWDYND